MRSVENEEDLLLYKLHNEASKRGKNVLSLRACEIVDFSSQYGSEYSISYTAENMLGPPSVFPRSGDSVSCYELRTYGKWWQSLPSYRRSKVNLPCGIAVESQDFVEFRVGTRVAPVLIRIYEVYNPGAIVKILIYCYETQRWITLWKEPPQILPSNESHCFVVHFDNVNFLSDYYRIEFHHEHLNYYHELDGLILYGEEKCSISFPSCSVSAAFFPNLMKMSFKEMENIPVAVPSHQHTCFAALPNEIIHLIISYLDLTSLCTLAQVSKLFQKICYDPVLYKDLNLQLYWPLVDVKALKSLKPRLKSLKSLNLSWCGNQGRLTPSYFNEFLESRGEYLTTLKLSCCNFLNDNCLRSIANHCLVLKVVSLWSTFFWEAV